MTTIYTTPNCVGCTATLRAFDRAGFEDYTLVDLAQHPDLLAEFKTLGHQQAPVVVTGDEPGDIWSGFRPDRINEFLKTVKEVAA